MPVITLPKLSVKYLEDTYLRGDLATAQQYCNDNNLTYVSYTADEMQFSNCEHGSRIYQYWSAGEWKLENGYHSIIVELEYIDSSAT